MSYIKKMSDDLDISVDDIEKILDYDFDSYLIERDKEQRRDRIRHPNGRRKHDVVDAAIDVVQNSYYSVELKFKLIEALKGLK